ncbi:DoxX family protein [Nonomuraea ferruginea]
MIENATSKLTTWLSRHSIDILRVSLGLVFVAFGTLKFFPGVSPAEALSVATLEKLSLGMLSGYAAQLVISRHGGLHRPHPGDRQTPEDRTGRDDRRTGRLLRTVRTVLHRPVPRRPPTLEAQYIFKDIVLAAAAMVIGARALGARLVPARERRTERVHVAA